MKRLILSLLTVALLPMTVAAQTNATSITSGGYYRMYSPAKGENLYADATNNGISIKQSAVGDNTDVYQFAAANGNNTIKSVGTDKYLNGFTSGTKFNVLGTKNWVTLSETSQEFQVKNNSSARNETYKSAWIIGYKDVAITDDNWFNTNVKTKNSDGGVLRWKVDEGDKDDEASYFYLYPCTEYTLNVSFTDGISSVSDANIIATLSGFTSKTAATTGNKLYVDNGNTFTAEALSIDNATYSASFTISGTTINVTIGLADKTAAINAANGVATTFVRNADCGSTDGWTNAAAKSNQDGPFGSKINCFEQSSTNVVSQTLNNMPAGTYLLQACVRGGNTKVTVALGGTSKEYQLVNGNNENSGTAWTTSRAIASAETYVGSTGNKGVAYNGWLKAELSYTLSSAGDLTISFTPSSNTWTQIYDVRLFKTDATVYVTQTSATTDATTTEVDLTTATTFSLFDLGVNKNALVKVCAGSAIANTENVINSDNTCAKLVLRDGAFDFGHTGSDFTATSVSYDRTFTANNASTVCLPFALTSSEASALGTFYTLSALSGTTLTFETASEPAAYTPYLFVPTATAFSSYSSKSIAATPAALKTSVSGADFIGTMTAQTLKSDGFNTLYGYKNGQFVKIGTGSGAHINPFRAYISIPGSSSPAPSFSIDFGGETTGINAVHGEGLKVNGYYNLNGQRVSQPSKGLYIMNGKKVIIK